MSNKKNKNPCLFIASNSFLNNVMHIHPPSLFSRCLICLLLSFMFNELSSFWNQISHLLFHEAFCICLEISITPSFILLKHFSKTDISTKDWSSLLYLCIYLSLLPNNCKLHVWCFINVWI